jgi:hypothetical protein
MVITFIFTAWLLENIFLIMRLADSASKGSNLDTTAIIVAVISALFAFASPLITTLLTYRQDKNQLFANMVSKERMEWIREMRKRCAELCVLCEQCENEAAMSEKQKETYLQAKYDLLLHLNHPDQPEQKIKYPLDAKMVEILTKPSYQELRAAMPDLRRYCMYIFKSEWDKIKVEAGDSKKKKQEVEKIQARMNGTH